MEIPRRAPRPPGRVLREEAFGVEAFGLGPELPVPVREVLAKEDGRAGRNRVPPDLVGLDGVANGGPDRRVEPHCLLDDAAGVIQRRQIVGAGVTAIEGTVDLVFEPLGRLGILREQVPGPGEGVGRCLVTGDEEREDVVAHPPRRKPRFR